MQASLSKQTLWSIAKQNPIKELIYGLLSIPIHAYGQGLLIIAVFLSAFSCIYVKTLQREQVHQLQSSHQQTEQLQQRWNQLGVIHDTWSSPDRIHTLAQTQGLVMPTAQNSIALSQKN